ncbi:unnamed protein product [Citrullus colocynthis]|uniref:Secreted protein n=1 Tax=Citrullus colocynthis TaxID=252529 RepID=A0ABP0YUL1_9ROSI
MQFFLSMILIQSFIFYTLEFALPASVAAERDQPHTDSYYLQSGVWSIFRFVCLDNCHLPIPPVLVQLISLVGLESPFQIVLCGDT